MYHKLKVILISMLVIVIQTACGKNLSGKELPTPNARRTGTATAPLKSPTQNLPSSVPGDCPVETVDLKLYMNVQYGYCLLYPAAYTLLEPRFIVINPTNAPGDTLGDAWVDITVEPAADRTAAQAADEAIAAVGSGFNITHSEMLVDNSQAIIVDGLPGQDSSRRVFIVNHDRLYSLIFVPWYPTADKSTPLEGLFDVIMRSLKFEE
jgi:hypothetical protein